MIIKYLDPISQAPSSPDVKKEECSDDELEIHTPTVVPEEKTEDIPDNENKAEHSTPPRNVAMKRKASSPTIDIAPTTLIVTTQAVLSSQLTPPLSADAINAPPTKMGRDEDSIFQKQQTQRYLELLCRLYPEQKRGVLELILKGCNNDIIQAIECILPSHERAIQQLSTLPSQSYSLSTSSKQTEASRTYPYTTEKVASGSAFIPFTTQPPPTISNHTYSSAAPCPPGCTYQHQKCECADCLSGKPIHSTHHHGMAHSPNSKIPAHISHMLPKQQSSHRMVPYIPVSSHVPSPHTEPVKICAGCGGKMKLEDQRCPNCEPEAKP